MKYMIIMNNDLGAPISAYWGRRRPYQKLANKRGDFLTDNINDAYRYIEIVKDDCGLQPTDDISQSKSDIKSLTIIEIEE